MTTWQLSATIFYLTIIYLYPISAGTAFCVYEHTSTYQSDLVTDQITGYLCKLDLDIKGNRVDHIQGYHENGEENKQVDIIRVFEDYYSYLTSFPDTICKKFENLEIIDMSKAEIETIEANSLENCTNLRILQFYMNKITEIPENLLKNNKKLLRLYISYNSISTLPENFLSGLQNLEILDLSYNKLDRLPATIFEDIKSLKHLNLDGNQFQILTPNSFKNLGNLEKLSIASNSIHDLPMSIFSNLYNLKELILEYNQLTVIHAESFPKEAKIDLIALTKNTIDAIDEDFIKSCRIKKLKMAGNKCDKTRLILKKDIKKKLKTCFDNYDELYRGPTMTTENDYWETTEEFTTSTTRPTTTQSTTQKSTTTIRTPRKPKSTTTTTLKTTTIPESTTTEQPLTTTEQPTTTTKTTEEPTTTMSTTKKPKSSTTTTEKPSTTIITTITTEPVTITEATTENLIAERMATFKPNTPETTKFPEPDKLQAVHEPCGVVKIGVPNMVGSQEISPNTHPWIAALVHKDQYFCGGTIVTKRKVVTAAHCILAKNSIEKRAQDIIVILGSHYLDRQLEVGRVAVGVQSIEIHPNWNHIAQKFDGDIAVLILDDDIEFSNYIQPACLTRNKHFVNYTDGIVVGFGKSETSRSHENVPKKANTPIHTAEDCYREFINLLDISSHRTFCGGFANGTGACTGDSGGGLTVVSAGRHFLRGVVSSSLYDENDQQTCGKVLVGRPNIVGGNYVVHGAFPWVAVLINDQDVPFCGGTLVTKNKVVTAAHCIEGKDNTHKFLARDIRIILGAHNLTKANELGKQTLGIQSMDVHTEWNTKSASYDADIAILTLTDNVAFSRFIQPICLMSSDSEIAKIKKGYSTGYGRSEKDTNSESVLKSVETPIAPSNEECFYENDALVQISSKRTFCGGSRDGAGVCLGDSGNGLFVVQSQTYYLKGIVSASLQTNNNCDVRNYAIFTDILKFNSWIIERVDQVDRPFIYGPSGVQVTLPSPSTTQRPLTIRPAKIRPATTRPITTIAPRRSPSIHPIESHIEVIEGTNFELHCNSYGSPSPTIRWASAIPVDENVRTNGNLLIINNISFRNSGKFTCQAVNSEGNDSIDVIIIVKSASSFGQVPWETQGGSSVNSVEPKEPPKQVTAELGGRSELKCKTNGNYRLDWRRADGQRLQSNAVSYNGILVIDNVRYADAGTYDCFATDSYGNSAVLLSAKVNVAGIGGRSGSSYPSKSGNSPFYSGFGGSGPSYSGNGGWQRGFGSSGGTGPPRISFQPNSFANPVTAGSRLWITCIITGSEPMTANWKVVGRSSSSSSARVDGSTLKFDNVLMSDEGEYACEATNSYGRTQKGFSVFVNNGFF